MLLSCRLHPGKIFPSYVPEYTHSGNEDVCTCAFVVIQVSMRLPLTSPADSFITITPKDKHEFHEHKNRARPPKPAVHGDSRRGRFLCFAQVQSLVHVCASWWRRPHFARHDARKPEQHDAQTYAGCACEYQGVSLISRYAPVLFVEKLHMNVFVCDCT